jgi:DNA helicase-2/ATP-dependent DNA helicase PcrA
MKADIKLTEQQQDFVAKLLTSASNIALVARAGCGKTSTILASLAQYVAKFPRHEVLIVAYGKAIEREIAEKLKPMDYDWRTVGVSTSHALGWGLVKFFFKLGKDAVDDNKVRKIVDLMNDAFYSEFRGIICQLVHLAKTEGFGFFDDVQIDDAHAWYEMADHYNVNGLDETDQMDRVIAAAQNVYKRSLSQTTVVDFDDMILFPLVKNLRVKFQKDLIYIDEAQDTSRARRALIRKFVKTDGRIVVVGDDRQAIMGFAGASADALEQLVAELHCVTMPLNVTWRCPKAVVAEAQSLVPDIQAAPTAPEGEVLRQPELPESFEPTDAILCRNTAPLVQNAYRLIKKGIACKVEGREIGNGLLLIVDRWKRITTIPAFRDKLEDFTAREIQKAQAKGKDKKIDELEDRRDTLYAICDAVSAKGRSDLDGVREFIANLFADDVKGVVTLCTYHRSKGREWPRVLLLEHGSRCPSPRAKKDWEIRQENNLAYVAITRAQKTLVYVS